MSRAALLREETRRRLPGTREYIAGTRAQIKAAVDAGDEERLKEIENSTARAVVHAFVHGGGHMTELADLSELAKDGLNLCIARRVHKLRQPSPDAYEELAGRDA